MPGIDDLLEACRDGLQAAAPARPILGEYDLVIELPSDVQAGDRLELRVEPGIYDRVGGGLCGALSGRMVRDGESSDWAELLSPGPCYPLPEPGLGIALLVGAIALVWAGQKASRSKASAIAARRQVQGRSSSRVSPYRE